MDISRGHGTSTGASSAPLNDTSGYMSARSQCPENRTRNGNYRLLASPDIMDEKARNSLNWEDFFGSSLDLAPSLLNLYDHTIASGTRHIDKKGDRIPNKTMSLPTRTPEAATTKAATTEAATTEVEENSSRLLPPKQQADRPLSLMDTEQIGPRGVAALDDNKKRPLSISSASSTSLTSSPRLRKKRQSAFNGWDVGVVPENCQDSQITLASRCDSDPRVLEGFELRTRMDSGSADGCKSGDGFFDSMSVTSSENGSFKDDVDHSGKDYAALLPLHSDRLNISGAKTGISNGSHIQPHSLDASKTSSIIEANAHSPLSSTPKKPIKSIKSTDRQFNGSLTSESSSPDGNLSHIEYDTIYSPNHSGRSSSSAPRHDARMKYFSNYEDSILHSTSLQAPIAEEDFDISPSPQGRSPKDSSSFSNSSSEAASSTPTKSTPTKTTRAKDSPSLHSSREKAAAAAATVTSAAPKSDNRRERSSQLSPSSDKTIRRADRGGSASSHDSQSASPRSGLARTSKKRDHLIMPDTGSRSSPVYASYVSKVVTEIIESERTYIASLENIIHGYLEPMERVLDSSDAKKDIACLFSNIRDIYKFGCMFLNDLEMAGADPVKVAQCFVKYNKGFVIYTDYCTNYPRAVEVLTRFMQHPDLSQLCKERQLALGHGLPLGAYLLKPVQRILKYHLLLHNIVKNCEKEKEEAAILEQAFLHMTHMAHHINEMKRKHEHAVRIQEIQSQLEDYVGEDLTRLGELVLEGSFKVSGAKASRQVFLFERGILISKIKEGGMLSCKTFIRCSNLMLVEVIPNEPLSFHIIPFDNPRAQDTLQARNMEQKLRWCHDIKKQILESFKGIPDNAKNLIMQLGRDHDDDYISKEVLDAGKRNQHTAPEYLEKRRFRRKSTSRLPDFRLLKPQKSKKGSNKKNESKSEEKISTGIIRRSESKSPERHGHIHSKQNFMTKRRSHSTSSSTVSLSSIPSSHLNDQSSADINNAISWPITKHLGHSSPKSPDSPVYRKSPNKFPYSKEEAQIEAEISKRPASFLMARANPVLLEDITLLLARCGGPRKLPSPPLLEDDKENKLSSLTDFPDLGELNFRSKSDIDTKQRVPAGKSGQVKKKFQYTESLVSAEEISSLNSSQNATIVSETEVSPHKSSFNQNVAETRRSDPKSMSLPDLYKAGDLKEVFGKFEEVIMDPDNIRRKTVPPKNKNDMNEINNFSKSRSHMSRKDIEYALQNFRRRMEDKGNKTARQNRESEIGNRISQSANENVLLKKTGLRLPNTSQLLAAKKCGPNPHTNEGSEKLVNSEEKLTRRSVDSLSHLNEDLWASGSLNAGSRSSMETESLNSSRHSLSVKRRPYGDYDTTDSMQVSNTRDTINFLQRNSVSTLQYSNSDAKENSQRRAKLSSQIHYATPPRSYMTLENMRKLGSVKDSDKPYFHFQDIRGSSLKNASSGTMKAFAISPVTVTVAKPVSFNTTNLLRSNSTPITSERHAIAAKTVFKGRPVSMDVDTLTEESNRLLAEMEEYISSSYENMSSTNKFPTSLPAIPVEEEPGSKRLSVVSSISTSSYESQDSNSSDGLIRTLKSKLRAWERLRNDSEYSYASSFTSDDEDQEEATHSESSSALELQIKSKIPWKANTESETLESSQNDFECSQKDFKCLQNDLECSQNDLEYSQNDFKCSQKDLEYSQKDLEYSQNDLEYSENELECPEIGSFLTNQLTHLPTEQVISHYHADFTDNELHPHGKYYLDSIDMSSETSQKLSVADDQLEQTPSNSPTPETFQALRSQSTDNVDHENSHSNYLPKYSSIKIMSLFPLTNEVVIQPEADLLLDESPEITDPVKVSFLNTVLGKETSDLRKDDSCELFNSNGSCHEREMSPVSDSEISKDEAENYEENGEGQLPRKSIREFVQAFEKKQREQSQRTLEIRRKEPSVLIRQRLETLRESALHGWRSSSSSSSRPASEERDFVPEKSPQLSHCMVEQLPFTFDNNNQNDTCIRSICAKILNNRDSMSKSVENLSKSRESVFLSRSREGLNAISDTSGNRHSVPSFSLKSSNAGHEKDAMRFHYKSSPTNLTSSGNQFMHKPHASLEPSVPLYESTASMATEFAPMQASRSMCQLDGLDADDDSLVVMKGWVRALISKFQENE